MASSPIVNGIEKELAEEATVVRVNLWQDAGKEIANQFGVTSAGTTLVFDGAGNEVYRRTSFPSRKEIVDVVRGAAS